MKKEIHLTQMANIVASEVELLHCTIEEAWNGMNSNITDQFNFEEVKALIQKLMMA